MELFSLVNCIDPSSITMSLSPKEFTSTYLPAYGDDWDNARDILLNSPADRAIIYQLSKQFKENHKFEEKPKVTLPQCDLEDGIEYPGQLANGMHRVTVLRAIPRDIEFSFYYSPIRDEDNHFTEVTLIFEEELTEEGACDIYSWVRSMPLDNGKWVEVVCSSDHGNTMYLSMDRVVDHKLVLKKLHSLAMLDEFSQFGLLEIHIDDVYDEGDFDED